MSRRKPTDTAEFKLRVPERLRRRIETAAVKNDRSLNSEMVARLEESFERVEMKALIRNAASVAAIYAVGATLNELGLRKPSKASKENEIKFMESIVEDLDAAIEQHDYDEGKKS